MPFLYSLPTKAVAENFTTSGTGNTEIDFAFVKPGATRPVGVPKTTVQGKGGGLTALSGISVRLKQFTTTSSSAGTAVTPAPKNNLAPASAATAGMGIGGGTAAVTSGTGGPSMVGYAGMGASGPGGTVAINPDDVPALDGGANKSIDFFSASPTATLNFEMEATLAEVGF